MSEFGVPVIVKNLIKGQWQVSSYQEFAQVLFPNGTLDPKLQKLIDYNTHTNSAGFRHEVVIDTFPFLCAVRPEEKCLYIGTRRLARELCLLKLYEINPVVSTPDDEKLLFKLKEHVERLSTLSPAQFPTEIEWVTYENNLPAFWDRTAWQDVDQRAQVIQKELVIKVGNYHSSLFEKFSDYGLSLTAKFDLIRIHLLKFLAVLPSLDHDKHGKEVKRNLLESLRRLRKDVRSKSGPHKRLIRQLPYYLIILFNFSYALASYLPAPLLAVVVRYLVRMMAKRFIAGESIGTSHYTLRALKESNRNATLDQLGELVVSAKEADEYFEKVLQLIRGLKQHHGRGEKNGAGILAAHVSIKVSALSHDFRPQAFDATFEKVAPRLRRILQEAVREEVFVNIDAEHYHHRDLVLKIYGKVLLETPDLKTFSQTGMVVQAYLRDGARHLLDVVALARARGLCMPIRLVKGAYWDAETIEGEAHQFTPPQFLNKEESDLHFRQLAYLSLSHHPHLQLAIGSHNIQDHAFVEALRELRFPQAPVIEHQCLHMTYEALSHGLAAMGWPTRNYMPIGNLLVGMAYLVRRIMENSSQVGVLSIMRSHQKASGLISPVDVHVKKKKEASSILDSFISGSKSDFTPVRPLRLHLTDERQSLETTVKNFHQELALKQQDFTASTAVKVICSSRPELILGTLEENTPAEATAAVDAAEAALRTSTWSKRSHTIYRVAALLKAADLMLLRRNSLVTLMVYEAGKTMPEALADVDEAIDFINFYARQEIALQAAKEKYTNRGVIAVIAPWNFPLAIPCGMTVAPLLAGNAVILKPAEQTPLIAIELFNILMAAGVPKGILQLILGDGEKVGAPLVTHAKTAGVVFTGSKSVGQWIYRHSAAEFTTHYHHQIPMQKKIITEMGGKNAIIVTNNCELDETISGILYAAFGHSGQKCSSASRVIVHKEVKEALVSRLVSAIADLRVGESLDPATTVSPLIGQHDQQRVRKCVEEAKDEAIRTNGKIHIDRSFEKLPGFCVGPALFEIPSQHARNKDSWSQREIFGPVIHLIEYESILEAVELFNGTEYALTGGVYSQSQDDIDFLLRFLRAGNLYINRPNTGARVGIEPFGGFKLSGTGPKAGGAEYVRQFHFPLSSVEAEEADAAWAKDSGYQLMIPRSSLISIAGRIQRFNSFAGAFIDQYEIFMGTVNEKDKGELAELKDWIRAHLDEYLTARHPNFVIPGQLSYNDLSLIKEAGLFINVSPRPSVKAVHYLFAALALGSGVSVACVTDASYQTWRSILELAWKAGFSKTNLDVTFLSGASLQKYFLDPQYSYVYAGSFVKYKKVLYEKLLEGTALDENMRLILSEIDGVSLTEPAQVLAQFVWARSVAINTMRHGAPLEMTI
ncbi:MAG TPA: proline dehydrogenase family protein [Bacteriovoracaceae bacterium]|nr:proline dehydrogenase family protein [Bacteriovoracaceae bacterium]